MNVLVTAGGTSEKIDNVRCISNMSTGRLGSAIASSFSAQDQISRIYYVCGKGAVIPKSHKIKIMPVDSVLSLENTVKDLFEHTDIDIIVHCMAVSDYRVRSVTSIELFADLLLSKRNTINDLNNRQAVTSLMKQSESVIKGDGKISSDVEDMMLLMERTPKIISMFRKLSPNSTLVGFKLLDNVSLDTLIDKGYQVLAQNKCDYVLANDLKDINGEGHVGYLIDKEKNYACYKSKTDIARAVVSAVLGEGGC